MVKHTQKIRRQQQTNFLSVFNHFVWLALKGLNWLKFFAAPILHFQPLILEVFIFFFAIYLSASYKSETRALM